MAILRKSMMDTEIQDGPTEHSTLCFGPTVQFTLCPQVESSKSWVTGLNYLKNVSLWQEIIFICLEIISFGRELFLLEGNYFIWQEIVSFDRKLLLLDLMGKFVF